MFGRLDLMQTSLVLVWVHFAPGRVLGVPTGDTHGIHISLVICGIHISRRYTYHCDNGTHSYLREDWNLVLHKQDGGRREAGR